MWTSILTGWLVLNISSIDVALMNNSNAISFIPMNNTDVTEYLSEIDNRVTPVMVIDHLYVENGKYVYKEPAALKQAISKSGQFGRMVFMFDEPLWRARRHGQNPEEVKLIMSQIRADFPGVEFATIYAYAELYNRYMENYGELDLWYGGEHIGFNCYGKFHGCGGGHVPEISQMTYLSLLYSDNLMNGGNAKIFMVPGAFKNEGAFSDNKVVIDQLHDYAQAANMNREYVSGFGLFTLDNVNLQNGGSSPDISQGAINFPDILEAGNHVIDMIADPDQYKIRGAK